MIIFNQTNKRILYGTIIIFVGFIGLDMSMNWGIVPTYLLLPSYNVFLSLLTMWAGILVLNRDL